MFESLALENPRNTRRSWTTAVSFALQTTGLALLVLAPIGYTQAVAPRFAEQIVAPSGITNLETHSQPPRTHVPTTSVPSVYQEGRLIFTGTPRNVRRVVDTVSDVELADPAYQGVFGGTNFGRDGVMNGILDGMKAPTVTAANTNTRTKPYVVSVLNPGMLIKQVQPVYPDIAKRTHTEGKVLLVAVIDTEGRIEHLRALSGHPFLIPAAIDAVQQWRYRPYILNGQAVEVETQIAVNFILQHD